MRLLLAACLAGAGWTGASPPVWPELVHAHCSQRIPGSAPGEDQLSQVELYYDWAAGRNANLIRGQHDALGVLFDMEWNNGSTYYYHGGGAADCRSLRFPVGILNPDWLSNATYRGVERVSGFDCERWEKADFIIYWNRVDADRRPVKWIFTDQNMTVDVISWVEGENMAEADWQVDPSCFSGRAARAHGGDRARRALPRIA